MSHLSLKGYLKKINRVHMAQESGKRITSEDPFSLPYFWPKTHPQILRILRESHGEAVVTISLGVV